MLENLFTPLKIGSTVLKNKIILAPLTRQSAFSDGTPTKEMDAYYARRAQGGVGLVITEGTYQVDEWVVRHIYRSPVSQRRTT